MVVIPYWVSHRSMTRVDWDGIGMHWANSRGHGVSSVRREESRIPLCQRWW